MRWHTGQSYDGDFLDGTPHGQGHLVYSDGRQYIGEFAQGLRTGKGTLYWPNGNRYTGAFVQDNRTGVGVIHWRDGTIYRGEFFENSQSGWGIKEQPGGQPEIQQWRSGTLQLERILVENVTCSLSHMGRQWMFDSTLCINGLAHGTGLAVSLDGRLLIPNGKFILGQMVSGSVLEIPEVDPDTSISELGSG
jgi:hypothetical protein